MEEMGARELASKKPFFRREIVVAKVHSLFPGHLPEKILQLLDEYKPRFAETAPRVQLAILKLSNGDLNLLRHHLDAAKRDYRDVILPAENPEFLRVGIADWIALSEDEKERITDSDVHQYLEWIHRM